MRTPWGESGRLRERKLPPGRGVPREEARRNQRERLLGAMVASCSERGYEATRVEDLVAISGVSRRAFYVHFEDKLACYLAAQEEILAAAVAVTRSELHRAGSWRARAEAALGGFVEMLIFQPAAARLVSVEAYAAGPEALRRIEEAASGFEALLGQAFEEMPKRLGMPDEMVAAMVGGLRRIVETRLRRGSEAELAELAPELLELGLSYQPPPGPLRLSRRGTAASPARAPLAESPVERLLTATLSAIAEQGYRAAKITEIASRAEVSLSTFYAHFDGKEAALEAALYRERAQMLGGALPAYQRGRSWAEAMAGGVESCLSYMAARPDFARVLAEGVNEAGAEALERRDRGIEAAGSFFAEGAHRAGIEVDRAVLEAVPNMAYALFCEQVRHKGTDELRALAPPITYLTLSPALGAERAYAVANGNALSRSR